MHPFARSWQRLALYLTAWVIVGLLLAALGWVSRPELTFGRAMLVMVPLALVFGLIGLSAWWVCRSVPLDRTPPLRAVWALGGAALQGSALWVAIATLWSVFLVRIDVFDATRSELFVAYAVLFIVGVPLYLISLAVHYLVLAFEAAREAERRVLESQVTAREAEVRALRAQLNPHFLFNSLNSINALVGTDPEGARRMCESLGDFLRRTLALGAKNLVTLSEELALVDRYFAIERVRFGERLVVERVVEAGAEGCMVPPLLLQPLVENAVKHGVAARVEGGTIHLAAAVLNGSLRLSVENDVDEDAVARPGEGVGLQNVKRRLDVLSARETRLETWRGEGRFRVTLTLPAREKDGAVTRDSGA